MRFAVMLVWVSCGSLAASVVPVFIAGVETQSLKALPGRA